MRTPARTTGTARTACAAVAIVIAAWFGIEAHDAHELSRAQSFLTGSSRLSAAQLAMADSALDAAGTLNPDSTVELTRGELALHAGRSATAQRIFEHVAADEPQNAEAWLLLAESAYGQGALLSSAVHHLAKLDPRAPKTGP